MKNKVKSLMAGAIVCSLFLSCDKKKPDVAPTPDTNTANAVDVAWMMTCISDIDMICSTIGEGDRSGSFYGAVPAAGNGTFTAYDDVTGVMLVSSFYRTDCYDGTKRDGSVFMIYRVDPVLFPGGQQTPNSRYMRDKGFAGNITLSAYKVNNWMIETDNGVPAKMFNNLESERYDPTVTKLTWYLGGKFIFTNPADVNQKMTCEVRLTKTLENSTDPAVFPPTKNQPINWKKAIISYYGDANGTTLDGTSFTFSISPNNKIMRDFTCYPSPILTTSPDQSGVSKPVTQEFHPFVNGIMSIKETGKYVRQLYFGNEGDPLLKPQCDNKAFILIQGNSYPVDLKK